MMKGKLKIYIGYAAGVGKTYRMLKDAHDLIDRGIDVQIGYIEPHQRPATMALTHGIKAIPLKTTTHHNHIFQEPHIDAIIDTQPDVVLIDELAHHNAPGSRHEKRYQDIEELLQSGINVYTTLNIQHIESLYHTIHHYTKVDINERVPDKIVKQADSFEFVDIEPVDLQTRMKEGKIYQEVQATRALDSFFQLDHLIQLRELALRELANLVDAKMAEVGLDNEEQMIAVGISPFAQNMKVIRQAARLAQAFKCQLTGIYIESSTLEPEAMHQLNTNRKLLESLGGRFMSLYGDESEQLGEWCTANSVTKVVLGRPSKANRFSRNDIISKLNAQYPHIDVYIIPSTSREKERKYAFKPWLQFQMLDVLKLILIMTMCTIISLTMFHNHLNESNTITVYMLGVILSALWIHAKVNVFVSSVSAVLLFNYFFTTPRFSFEAYREDYPATFTIMFVCGIIMSSLVGNVKQKTKIAKEKTYRTEVLLETNKLLMQSVDEQAVIKTMKQQFSKLTKEDVMIIPAQQTATFPKYEAHLKWVKYNQQEAGYSTETFPGLPYYLLPVNQQACTYIIMIPASEQLAFEKEIILSMWIDMTNVLEKMGLYKKNKQQEKEKEREMARSTFLKSISHDIRTPLTSIIGNLEVLEADMTPQQQPILKSMKEDATWLNNMVNNILTITKLDYVEDALPYQSVVIADVIYNAYQLTEKRAGTRNIMIEEPDAILLAKIDEKMMTQVLINLIENAIKYTPEYACITISLRQDDHDAIIEVKDNGYGVDEAMQTRIFDQYYTSDATSDHSRKGLGLGLYLCQMILKRHHTSLYIKKNEPNGAIFGFKLSLEKVIH
ncbi:sensor histidine kinase KdpD [Staphylococcus hyicus]|uniref:sensor histidine kinase n=1 Tax=Staphylococcus hyicus TaxID=1284 RepID=UPI00217E9426|nr:sensor histidine kinase KdpD [Staphylococcus hyicus]UWF56880.1 sensor histidine kinase KdpD [Staphylococcus hyicus]